MYVCAYALCETTKRQKEHKEKKIHNQTELHHLLQQHTTNKPINQDTAGDSRGSTASTSTKGSHRLNNTQKHINNTKHHRNQRIHG